MEAIYVKARELGYELTDPRESFHSKSKDYQYMELTADGTIEFTDVEPPVGIKINFDFFNEVKPVKMVSVKMPEEHWMKITNSYAKGEWIKLTNEAVRKWRRP